MKQSELKIVIGITGRTATGKSTLAAAFAARGYELIDADVIYRDLLENCSAMKKELFDYFGTLDRKLILEEISINKRAYEMLNSITHKYVTMEIIERLSGSGSNKFVLDVPVPVKEGFSDLCNYIITTDCSEKLQIERLMARNGYSQEEAMRRTGLQMSSASYMEVADFIVNTGGMKAIQIEETVLNILKSMAKLDI